MKKLINWSELSRLITKGDRNCIRSSKIPAKHQPAVNDLLRIIKDWAERWGVLP